MATDYKVTELGSPLTPLDGTEVLYVVDGSTDRQTTTQDVADLAGVPAGVVSFAGSAVVPGQLPQFASTDGTTIEDSGYSAADLVALIDAVDSAVNNRMQVPHRHVASDIIGLSSGSGHTIEDEGTPVTQRSNMNFTGAGVSVADSGGKTVVTISGGGGGMDFLTVQAFS